jgi:hypothetical protein
MGLLDYVTIYIGVAAIATGVLAVFITLMPPMSKRAKTIWAILFCFLALTGSGALFWQQNIISQNAAAQSVRDAARESAHVAHDSKADQDNAFMKGQMSTLISLTSHQPSTSDAKRQSLILERLENDIKNWAESNKGVKNDKAPLKTRASLLATEILRFTAERYGAEPSAPIRQTLEEFELNSKKMNEFSNETMTLYSMQFASRVIAIHDEFADNGLNDNELNKFYKYPAGLIGMEVIAEHIGALALKLP